MDLHGAGTFRRGAVLFEARASRWKAVATTVASLAMLAVVLGAAKDASLQAGGVVAFAGFATVFTATASFGLLNLIRRPRLTATQDGLEIQSWFSSRFYRWSEIGPVATTSSGAVQLLIIPKARGLRGRSHVSSNWTLTPHEIQGRLEALRTSAQSGIAFPVEVSPERTRSARLEGMSIFGLTSILAFLSMLDTQMAPHAQRPPGGDHVWINAPSSWQIGLIGVALVGAVLGLSRWLWPAGRPISPPTFSTVQEHLLLGWGVIAFGMAGFIGYMGIRHPGEVSEAASTAPVSGSHMASVYAETASAPPIRKTETGNPSRP